MDVSRRTQGGFTLIDVMIVVVILAILASVVLPVVSGHLTRAQDASAATTEAMVRKALDLYFQRYATWPETIEADLFRPPEPVTMPRGYQLHYWPDSGELELAEVEEADLDTALPVVVME